MVCWDKYYLKRSMQERSISVAKGTNYSQFGLFDCQGDCIVFAFAARTER